MRQLGEMMLTGHLEAGWRHLGEGQTLPDHLHASSAAFPSVLLLFCVLFSVTRVVHYHTDFSPFSPSLYSFSRAARQISLHQDLLCQRVGELLCVYHLWLLFFFFFFNGSYFSLQFWRTLLLRSEEAGYLPDSNCAEVITVLYSKKGVQEWGLGGRQFDSFSLCFSWKH